MKVLVTGVSGDIGEAVGRILLEAGHEVVGADASDPWPGRATFEMVHPVPWASDPGYVDAVRALLAETGADLVVPCSEPEIAVLARTPDVRALVLAADLVDVFGDKLTTARWLDERGLGAPRTTPLEEATSADLPLVVKPRRGAGGRGVVVVRTEAELAAVAGRPDHVAQALLEDDDAELTCAVVRLGGEVRMLQLRRRMEGSVTASGVVERHADVEALLHGIATGADLDGSLNVQLRLTPDGPRVFEVNPRLSSTVMLRHRLGFQDLLWWLAGEVAPFEPPVGARVFRLAREVVDQAGARSSSRTPS